MNKALPAAAAIAVMALAFDTFGQTAKPTPAKAPVRIDFKGVRLGVTEAELTKRMPGFTCIDRKGPAHDRECNLAPIGEHVTYGGAGFTLVTAYVSDSIVRNIYIDLPDSGFDTVVHALRDKFGPPDSGQGSRIMWIVAGEAIIANRHSAPGASSIQLFSRGMVNEAGQKAKSAPKDL